MKGNMIIRQGEVILRKTKEKASGKIIKSLVLADGQYGHPHILTGQIKGDKTFFTLEESGILSHPEHGNLELKKGSYKVNIKTEYDPIEEIIREIKD